MKGGASARPGVSAGGAQGAAAASAGGEEETEESGSWHEFKHPQFRRGRMDLLVGIKRQKDGASVKRKLKGLTPEKILVTFISDGGCCCACACSCSVLLT